MFKFDHHGICVGQVTIKRVVHFQFDGSSIDFWIQLIVIKGYHSNLLVVQVNICGFMSSH